MGEVTEKNEEIQKKSKLGFLENYKFPVQMYGLLFAEFFYALCVFANQTVIILYYVGPAGMSRHNAIILYHTLGTFGGFTPIVGGYLSDNYFGRFNTLAVSSAIYFLGLLFLAITSYKPILDVVSIAGPILGGLLLNIGGGGLKPTLQPLAADQIPENEKFKVANYFSLSYMLTNVAAILSMLLIPIARSRVYCFGDECFPLVFGISTLCYSIYYSLLLAFSKKYVRVQPARNISGELFRTIFVSFRERFKHIKEKEKPNFLDWAYGICDSTIIEDTKAFFRILSIFILLPVFWALYNQQSSLWTLQASKMSGKLLGSEYMVPDQMQVINPILIIILLPFLDYMYGVFEKFNIKNKPLRKICIGMFICGCAFYISGGIEILMANEKSDYIHLKKDEYGVRLYNSLDHSVRVNLAERDGYINYILDPNTMGEFKSFNQKIILGNLFSVDNSSSIFKKITIADRNAQEYYTYWVTSDNSKINLIEATDSKDIIDSSSSEVRFIILPKNINNDQRFYNIKFLQQTLVLETGKISEYYSLPVGKTDVTVHDTYQISLSLPPGGSYILIIRDFGGNNFEHDVHVDLPLSKYHMLLQFPQIFIVAVAEVLVSVTGITFAYTQAPARIKSAIFAAYVLSSALGNLIVTIIEAAGGHAEGDIFYFIFATLLVVVSVFFGIIAYYYKPYSPSLNTTLERIDENKGGSNEEEKNRIFQSSNLKTSNSAEFVSEDDEGIKNPSITGVRSETSDEDSLKSE